jgi:hypothetical protein
MNDPQLIKRLANTDLYRDDAPLPEVMRSDIVLLDIARRIDMDTMQRTQVVVKPPRQKWTGAWIAAAAFALVLVIGLGAALLANLGGDPEPIPPAAVNVNAADPIQATHDQSRRITITFAGNAQALAESGADSFEVVVHMEGSNDFNPGFTLTYTNDDGVVTTSGVDPDGAEVVANWQWFADDGLLITLPQQGLPDTRPEVTISVQQTATSDVVQFEMDAPAPSSR